MKPKWMLSYVSCPDCGLIIDVDNTSPIHKDLGWNCPKCKCHYSHYDFWKEHELKFPKQYETL